MYFLASLKFFSEKLLVALCSQVTVSKAPDTVKVQVSQDTLVTKGLEKVLSPDFQILRNDRCHEILLKTQPDGGPNDVR